MNFDTTKVILTDHMFCRCSVLKSLDLSYFNTSNMKKINTMFYNSLSSISLNFDTSKVIYMYNYHKDQFMLNKKRNM